MLCAGNIANCIVKQDVIIVITITDYLHIITLAHETSKT